MEKGHANFQIRDHAAYIPCARLCTRCYYNVTTVHYRFDLGVMTVKNVAGSALGTGRVIKQRKLENTWVTSHGVVTAW